MKTTLRNFIFVLFAVGGMALLAGNARGADDMMPPEVKTLIGMKIPPKALGHSGDIPGWDNLWSSGVVGDIGFDLLQQGKTTVLIIDSRIEQNTTILDVRVIPGNLLNFYLKDSNLELKKNDMQMYRITEACMRAGSEKKEIILGMWRHEPGSQCEDSSTLVKKAWLLNPESGRLTDISTKGVSCRELICGED